MSRHTAPDPTVSLWITTLKRGPWVRASLLRLSRCPKTALRGRGALGIIADRRSAAPRAFRRSRSTVSSGVAREPKSGPVVIELLRSAS